MISLPFRCIAIAICFCTIQPISAFTVAQNQNPIAEKATAVEAQSKLPDQYLITLAEYRLKGVDVSEMTADNIVAAIRAAQTAPVETIILSAIDGAESQVKFGRVVSVTTGRVTNRDGNRRQIERTDIGTVLNVTPQTAGQQVGLVLEFSSTSLSGKGTEDSPPDTVATSLNVTRMFDIGKPTLIGATTAGETSYILLTVSRL